MGPLKSLKLGIWVAYTLFRSGILPIWPVEWFKIWFAFRQCGPSFAFLGQVAALRFGPFPALIDDDGTLTFQELKLRVAALARFLKWHDGIQPGHRVAIRFSNHRGFVISLLALTRIGADVLPLNPRLPDEVLHQYLDDQSIDYLLEEGRSTLSEELPTRTWSENLDASGALPRIKRAGQLIVLTSGSTGVSKGIVRRPTLADVLPVTAGMLRDLPIRVNRPAVLAIPFYHGYGIATLAMSLGLGCSLTTGRRYDIPNLLKRTSDSEPPLLVTVPTLLWRWLKGSQSTSKVAAVVTGSAPLSGPLCRRLLARLGPVVYNLYGATETGLLALATPEMLTASPGCVGLPLPGNEVRLGDDIGEISVRGPLVLNPGEDGWLKTGDLGKWDRNGYLHVCGRVDAMIVSGGENVFPHELGDLLSEHPELGDSAVLVVADEEFGQRLIAAVVKEAGSSLNEDALLDWLRPRLERFKQPRAVVFLDSLPRNELGKLRSAELRALVGE